MTDDGYLLHQWDWSETSLVLELFTRRGGRVAAVARGAKRPYSQLRPALMPFQPLRVALTRPKRAAMPAGIRDDGPGASATGDDALHLLRAADFAGGTPLLPPARLLAGFHLNELVVKFVPREDPHETLYDLYVLTLVALAQASDEAAVAAALRAFELSLLQQAGVLPALDVDTLTLAPVDASLDYRLQADLGLLRAGRGEAAWPGWLLLALQTALTEPRLAPRHAALLAICRQGGAPLRAPLASLLLHHAGATRLRTHDVMQQWRRVTGDAPRRVAARDADGTGDDRDDDAPGDPAMADGPVRTSSRSGMGR